MNADARAFAFDRQDLDIMKSEVFPDAGAEGFGRCFLGRPARSEALRRFGATETLRALGFGKHAMQKMLVVKFGGDAIHLDQINAEGGKDGLGGR